MRDVPRRSPLMRTMIAITEFEATVQAVWVLRSRNRQRDKQNGERLYGVTAGDVRRNDKTNFWPGNR